MRRLIAALIILISNALYSAPKEYFLFVGNCILPFDPLKERDRIDSSYFACLKSKIALDTFYMPAKTLGVAGRFEGTGSLHYGTQHAFFIDYYYEQMGSSHEGEVPSAKNNLLNTAVYQYGNPSVDHFRLLLGHQKPAFGVNQFPESIGYNQMFDPRYIWGLPETNINLIFDSQEKSQLEFGWYPDESRRVFQEKIRDHAFTTRMMYDFSLNGSTRSIFSLMIKKSGEKRLGLGIVSIGPNQNIFQAEWVRHYSTLSNSLSTIVSGSINGSKEGLNSTSYMQLIRLSYQDPPGRPVRTSFLFDDLSFQYRLFAFGVSYKLPWKWSTARVLLAYRQDISGLKRSRWIIGTGIGFHL